MSESSVDRKQNSSSKEWIINEKINDTQVLFRRSSLRNSKSKETLLHAIEKSHEGKLYNRRWLILIFYNLAVLINVIPYEVCVPISTALMEIYDVSSTVVTLSSTTYMIVHPIISFQCSQIIANHGWALSTNIGVLMTILGCAIKIFIFQLGFSVVIIGQIFVGIGRPLILNSQASMAMNWFQPNARIMIITLLNVMHTLAMVLSVYIPGKLVFKAYKAEKDNATFDEGRDLTNWLMMLEFLISLTLIPCFLILRSKPQSLPVKVKKIELKAEFFKNMKLLMRNLNFMLVFVPFSMYFGILKALLVIIEQLLNPFNYQYEVATVAASIPLMAGLFAQAGFPYFINRYNLQKSSTSILLLIATCSVGAFYFAIRSTIPYFIYVDIAILAIAVMPAVPVMMDLSCDLVYPINTSFAVGAMYMGSTLLMVLFAQGFALILSENTKWKVGITLIIITTICFVGFVMFLFVRTNYEPVKVAMTESNQKYSFGKPGSSSSFYQESSLFNCSFNIGLIGDVPTINFDYENIIDEVVEEENQQIDQQ